jgi:threo-3-hydroxy-L-aspartate ammonia-lyase
MDQPTAFVTLASIRDAAERLRGIALVTPLVPFATLDGRPILLKAESLQPIGAFKIRGAYNAISRLDGAARERGVVAASSGNHAQGVARAARLLGVRATVFMPVDAPAVKRDRVRADGAQIIEWDPADPVFIQDHARAFSAEHGAALIHSYDNDDVIAGQGTAGLEIAEAVEDLGALLVPVGGGGLISGMATAVRALHPRTRIVGVEPALAADAQESFRSGRLVQWPRELGRRTIADGARTNLAPRTFDHITRLVDDIVTVDEAEIAAAVRLLAERSRLVVEPSGALGVAAATFRAAEAGLGNVDGLVVALVSGGNVDPARFRVYLDAPVPGA